MAVVPEPAVRPVSLGEVVTLVAAKSGQPLCGPYPTTDRWMPNGLLFGLYYGIEQVDALNERQMARATAIGFGGEGAQAAYDALREDAFP